MRNKSLIEKFFWLVFNSVITVFFAVVIMIAVVIGIAYVKQANEEPKIIVNPIEFQAYLVEEGQRQDGFSLKMHKEPCVIKSNTVFKNFHITFYKNYDLTQPTNEKEDRFAKINFNQKDEAICYTSENGNISEKRISFDDNGTSKFLLLSDEQHKNYERISREAHKKSVEENASVEELKKMRKDKIIVE